MATYAKASGDVFELIEQIRIRHYPDLVESETTVGCLFAKPTYNDAGDPTGPAIRHQGYPAQATIKVISLKDRVAGLPDCVMTIDEDNWDELTTEQRLALIDHELYHLEVKRDEEGQIVADDHGRPKLKCRLHDWQIGGFAAIVRRHQEAAPEYLQAKHLVDEYGQLLFPWMTGTVPMTAPVGDSPKRRGKTAS